MGQDLIDNDLHVRGTLTAQTMIPPSGTITAAMIAAAAGIQASKIVRHQSQTYELYAEGTPCNTLASKLLHTVRGTSGTLVGYEAVIHTAANDSSTIAVDLQKATAGAAFASVLSATISITSGTAVRTPVAATINSSSMADGDLYRAVVTEGTTTTLPQGLSVTLTWEETYT